ncbi:hypothetical protein MIR68_011508 [Amoeboaphelidium protococcarum]|nr:hypothetical protein MIR68_011508 [Amoeboaphelidium protococcarum]
MTLQDHQALLVTHKDGVSVYKNLGKQLLQQNPVGTYKLPQFGNKSASSSASDLQAVCSVATGNRLFIAANDAPLMYQYNYSKGNPVDKTYYAPPSQKSNSIGLISAMICSSNLKIDQNLHGNPFLSDLLIAGTTNGLIIVWNMQSGVMLKNVKAHFGAVTSLDLAGLNGDILISCGGHGDSVVHLWNLLAVHDLIHSDGSLNGGDSFDGQLSMREKFYPVCSLKDHTARVNSVYVSMQHDLFATCSDDNTVKVWTISPQHQENEQQSQKSSISAQCLLTIVYQEPIKRVILDAAESMLFAGSLSGCVYALSLLPQQNGKAAASTTLNQTVQHFSVNSVAEQTSNFVLSSHKSAVSGMQFQCAPQFDQSQLLFTSDLDGYVKVWDTDSRQLLHTINFFGVNKMGPVYGIEFIFNLPSLFVKAPQIENQKQLRVYRDTQIKLASTVGSDVSGQYHMTHVENKGQVLN